jgi:hypothetical protein
MSHSLTCLSFHKLHGHTDAVYVRVCLLFILCATLLMHPATATAAAIPVELKHTEQGWQLLRDGKPYVIKGAGGKDSLEQLAAAGANSIRTWGADDIDDLLDEAHALGLTVTLGIWLGHERHGFDYNDAGQVQEQFEKARQTVLRYKDHPALLVWGLGNEMEGYESGDDPAIWKAVNDIAVMVKQLDPLHPTMTITAELGGERLRGVQELCPAIDIHGINSYGGAPSLPKRYREGGGHKPYILTEFGPPGGWESGTTEWGAPFELNSTEKAAFYKRSYQHAIMDNRKFALGSYAFLWGHKMEGSPTWHGMFLADGARLAMVDVMTELWSGSPPADLSPEVQPLVIDGEPRVEPGDIVSLRAAVRDPEGKPVRAHWELRQESGDYATGGDFRPVPTEFEGAVIEGGTRGARVRMPEYPGAYRVYLYAYDAAGNAATANVPLYVEGEVRTPMPYYVYEDGFEGMPWVPSGWMGSIDDLTLDGEHTNKPHSGKHCIKLRFKSQPGAWVGVAWQHPANNWGEMDGGFDLTGAKYLELWARGEYGFEKMDIGVGLLGSDTAFPDSSKTSIKGVALTSEWARYRIPLEGLDLSSIKTGFVITLSGQRTSVNVYLDSIRFIP